ncbi:MAG TPA: hypothetical protein VGJ14_13195 [Sporichthyaceae bacterium]|jgi:hypothetical protein
MTLTPRSARFLIGVAVWNVVIYTVFIKNLWFNGPRDRPTGFYVAHTVLVVVNMAIAAVLAPLGWRALRGQQ